MKITTGRLVRCVLACAVGLSVLSAFGQTNLNFTDIRATAEGAIRFAWNSTSNEVYEIQYADQLNGNDDGTTAWFPLYTDYPSHGTNTFIADDGNYASSPEILHPRNSPMRFYRVNLVQTNDASTNPTVSILSPANGAILSGDVEISAFATTSDILSDIKLYIDGEEQWGSVIGTNFGGTNIFQINTCEYLNGPHVIFATAKSQSGLEGIANGDVITYGRSVSSYMNVTFSNLVTRVDLSERFFEPALGQTQTVTASFAANVDWTLEIQDESDNTKRFVSGSGTSMSFDWDGTGTNGADLPDGVYSYLISAQTNGQSFAASMESESMSLQLSAEETNSPDWFPTSKKQAIAAGWDSYYVKFPPLPPYRSNGVWVIREPQPPIEVPVYPSLSLSMLSESSSESSVTYGGAPTQSTRAPKRKWKIGVKGKAGSFGICYKTYGTTGFRSNHPQTGLPFPLPTSVAIDTQNRTEQTVDRSIPTHKDMAEGFAEVMTKKGWRQAFMKANNQWNDRTVLKTSLSGTNIFSTCNLGWMMTHGSFGNDGSTGAEADGIHYTYIWLGENSYVKFPDFDFGSSGTNGLRWMTISACNIMRSANYNSMNNAGKIPVNADLHLLMGPSTTSWASPNIGKFYASYLVNTNATIINSFVNAMIDTYKLDPRGITNTVKVAISGWSSCFNDSLKFYEDPDLNGLQYTERTTFVPP